MWSNMFQVIVSDIVYLMEYLLYGQTGKNTSVQLEEQKKGESFHSKISLEANITLKYDSFLLPVGTILNH